MLIYIIAAYLRSKPSDQNSDSEGSEVEADVDLATRQMVLKTYEGRIDLQKLRRLKATFDRSHGGDGVLSEDEFVQAFSSILHERFSPEELRLWFVRIDANANGSIDWDEFSTFLLLEVPHCTLLLEPRFRHPSARTDHPGTTTWPAPETWLAPPSNHLLPTPVQLARVNTATCHVRSLTPHTGW